MDKLELDVVLFDKNANQLTLSEWIGEVDDFLSRFKFEDINENNYYTAKACISFFNAKEREIEKARKEYFKPYEDLKKQLIAQEKKIKAVSNDIKERVKQIESNNNQKEETKEQTFRIAYTFVGTAKFYDDLEKLVKKHGAIMELGKRR